MNHKYQFADHQVNLWIDVGNKSLFNNQCWDELKALESEAKSTGKKMSVLVGGERVMDLFTFSRRLINYEDKVLDFTTRDIRKRFLNEVVPNSKNLEFLLLTNFPENINPMIPPSYKKERKDNVAFGVSGSTQSEIARKLTHLSKVKANPKCFLILDEIKENINLLDATISRRQYMNDQLIDCLNWVVCLTREKIGIDKDWIESISKLCHYKYRPFYLHSVRLD